MLEVQSPGELLFFGLPSFLKSVHKSKMIFPSEKRGQHNTIQPTKWSKVKKLETGSTRKRCKLVRGINTKRCKTNWSKTWAECSSHSALQKDAGKPTVQAIIQKMFL